MGVNQNNEWMQFWRIPTNTSKDSRLFYDVEIRNRILESGLIVDNVQGVILSTVVPQLKEDISEILYSIFKLDVTVVGPNLYDELSYEVPRPYEIGTDLVSNAYAAFRKYQQPCIIVDFGTALTFTTVSDVGYIKGVAIAPGIKTAMKALSNNTAQLPEIPLEIP